MTATEKLLQIKNWLFGFEQSHQFKNYKSEDGKNLQVDGELSEGKEIYNVKEDGTTSPLEDGEYIVEGKTMDVSNGVINSMKTKSEIEDNPNIPQAIKDEIKQKTMSEQKFLSDSLLDGTEVSVNGDSIEVGKILSIMKDGQSLKPPAGEHQLKSGVVVSVDEEGKILSVKPVEKEDDEEENGKEVSIEVESKKESKDDEDVKSMMKKMMEAVESIKQKMSEMEDKQKKMKEEFSSFKKEPAGEPIKRFSQPTIENQKDYRMQVIEMLRNK